MLPLLLLALLAGAVPGDAHATPDLARLRALYLAVVTDAAAIEPALAEVRALRARGVDGRVDALLSAYVGAVTTLRAKHGVWPLARMRHLHDGLRALDRVAATHPDLAEARYLRLMSCYYLPGFLGRRGNVRADFRALARLLPRVRQEYPQELYGAIARFVLDEGELTYQERRPLEDALVHADG